MKKMGTEFKAFLQEFNVAAMAIAFVVGLASKSLVESIVNDLFMPILNPFIPGGTWETATLSIGPIQLQWGAFASTLLEFVIIMLAIFIVAKKLLKLEATK